MSNPTFPTHGTQQASLLALLLTGQPIEPLTSWNKLGIYRLAAVVLLLRESGWPIASVRLDVHNRFGDICHVAEYSLLPDAITTAGDAGRQFIEDERDAMRNRLRRA